MNLPSLSDVVNEIKDKAHAYSDDHTKKANACVRSAILVLSCSNTRTPSTSDMQCLYYGPLH